MIDPTDTLGPPLSDRLAVLPQYLLPKQALTALAGRIARARGGALTTRLVRWFIARYGVNMAEAAQPEDQEHQQEDPKGKQSPAQGRSASAAQVGRQEQHAERTRQEQCRHRRPARRRRRGRAVPP